MYIDSHFHYKAMLNRDTSLILPESLIGLEIGLNGGDLSERIKLVGNDKNIFLSVGAGPWVLDRDNFISIDNELDLLESDIECYGADAIGEIGFDNHWNYGTKEQQNELFEKQVAIARKYNLPVAIHSRDADKELLESMDSGLIDNRTILHCFSSGKDVAKKLLEKGAYISFAGNVTYKSNKIIQEAATIVPLDRILVETDAPYLTPSRKRGEINRPEYTELTLEKLATLKSVDKEELRMHIQENFYKVMGKSESVVKRDISTV